MPKPDLGLSEHWRKAAVDRWHDSQDHVGQADTNPEPYAEAAGDAAVRVVLEHLTERIREAWVSDVDPEGRSDLDQMWNNALLIPRREIEALLKEVTDA